MGSGGFALTTYKVNVIEVYRKFKRYFATVPSGMHPLGCGGHQHPPSRSYGLPALSAAGRPQARAVGHGQDGWLVTGSRRGWGCRAGTLLTVATVQTESGICA